MSDDLKSVSTYYLLLELLNEGHAGLLPDLEPISEGYLHTELRRRNGNISFEKEIDWAYWFIRGESDGSELERANLLIFVENRLAMERLMAKIDR